MPRRPSPIGLRVIQILPCLNCEHGAKACEEVVAIYLDALHGLPPPRSGDRPWRFLPRHCCRQRQDIDAAALVA